MSYINRRNIAMLCFSKYSIAVAGNRVINPVTNAFWNYSKYQNLAQEKAKVFGHFKYGVAFCIEVVFFEIHNAFGIFEIDHLICQKASSKIGLEGGKKDIAYFIMFEHKTHGPEAKQTVAVKKYYFSIIYFQVKNPF